MEFVDPKKIRLLPGQGVSGIILTGSDAKGEVGLILRSESGSIRQNGDLGIEQRGGVVQFNDVILVLTMVKVQGSETELFDIWWNFYSETGSEFFERMSAQERLTFHFCDEPGSDFSIDRENGFRRFFGSLPGLMKKTKPWSDAEFDRAVRGFCAQSYPKENLWEMIGLRPGTGKQEGGLPTIDDYPGFIPHELRPFYVYLPDEGHCIRVVPSILEEEASKGNAEPNLMPAPVKTVLRGGVRWVGGYPVAPIPFIPGHGLAVPPDDKET